MSFPFGLERAAPAVLPGHCCQEGSCHQALRSRGLSSSPSAPHGQGGAVGAGPGPAQAWGLFTPGILPTSTPSPLGLIWRLPGF